MLADERVLWMAQREARACSRIVECLQRIPVLRLSNGALAYSTVSNKIISSVKHYEGFVRGLTKSLRHLNHTQKCMNVISLDIKSVFLKPFQQNSHNIALEAHAIKASSFNGMTCTLFQKVTPDRAVMAHFAPRDPDINPDRQLSFKCNVTSNLSALALKVSG